MSTPTPTVTVSWSRARGRMVESTVAHLVDPTGVGRTLCGVTVPPMVWRWVTHAVPQRPAPLARVWVDDDRDIEQATPCQRCARSRSAGSPVTVTQWHRARDLG